MTTARATTGPAPAAPVPAPRTDPAPQLRTGSGPTVVLLHGIAGSWRMWNPVIPLLRDDFDLFAPTLAGHRGAPSPPRPATVRTLTDELEDRLDAAGIDDCHLVGNSLGGWIALELARRGRARSVLALSPAGAWRTRGDERRLGQLMWLISRLSRQRGMRAALARPPVRRAALRLVCERGDRIPTAAVPGMIDDILGCTVFGELVGSAAAQGSFLTQPFDPTCRVSILWGQHDRLIPYRRYGRPYAEFIRGARIGVLPGAGHLPMYDAPEAVADAVRRVVRDASEPG